MTPTNFKQWAIWHATYFGLHTDRDAEMVLAWAVTFHRRGVTLAELIEASESLKGNAPPRWEQETALWAAIHRQRAAALDQHRREQVQEEEKPMTTEDRRRVSQLLRDLWLMPKKGE